MKGRCSACGALHDFALKRRLCTGDRRTYVFDLDGTLCEPATTMYLQIDPVIVANAKPMDARIGVVKRLAREGAIIIIHTARASSQHMPTLDWLEKHGVPCDGLILGKPFGDCYVDDKGINAEDFFKSKGVK